MLNLNVTRQFLLYADDINVYGEGLHKCAIKKNTEMLLGARKKTGLEVNVEKTKYTIMCREKQSEENHNVKTCNKSLEGVAHYIYCGTN
jgi:hypothetical protein